APSQRPVGAWTGRELLLLVSSFGPDGKPWPASLARAAAYDPATNAWHRIAPLPETGLGALGTAAWDGRELLVVAAGKAARPAWVRRLVWPDEILLDEPADEGIVAAETSEPVAPPEPARLDPA